MGATLERCEGTGYTLRAGPPHQRRGDPFTAGGTVDLVGTRATVRGYWCHHPLALAEYAELRPLLRGIGARTLRVERCRRGHTTIREYRL